jgi:hypothetical protein
MDLGKNKLSNIIVEWTCFWNSLPFTAKLWSFLMEQSKHLSISLEPSCDKVAQNQLLDPICYFNCRFTTSPYPHSPEWKCNSASRFANHHEECDPGWGPGIVRSSGFIFQSLSDRYLGPSWRGHWHFVTKSCKFVEWEQRHVMICVAVCGKN